jgi:hypothetical protein
VGAAKEGDAGRPGLLGQLPARGGLEVLARVDAALRELPVVRSGRIGPAAQPNAAVPMEEDDADVGAIKL